MNQSREIATLEKEIAEKKEALAALRRANREEVADYNLDIVGGSRPLSSFFGDKDELVVVHNMGRSCNYCTLWADGFNGFLDHFLTRSGFVLVSADSADQVSETAKQRKWNFDTASNGTSGFAAKMGYESEDGSPYPGISVFTREDGKIYRHGHSPLGEGDDFCSIWHVWALFPRGWAEWEPK